MNKKLSVAVFLSIVFIQLCLGLNNPGLFVVDNDHHQIIKISTDGSELLRLNYLPGINYDRSKIISLIANSFDGSCLFNILDYNSTSGGYKDQQLVKVNLNGEEVIHLHGLYGTVYGLGSNDNNGEFYYLFNHVMARGHYQLDRINADNSIRSLLIPFYNEATAVAINKTDGSIYIASPSLMDLSANLFNVILTKFSADGQKIFAISDNTLSNFLGGNHLFVNSTDGSCTLTLKNVNAGNAITDIIKYDSNGNKIIQKGGFVSIKALAGNNIEGTYLIIDENNIIKLDSNLNEIFRITRLTNPAYLAIDETSGAFFVSDTENHQIVKFDKEGNELLTITGIESPGIISFIPAN